MFYHRLGIRVAVGGIRAEARPNQTGGGCNNRVRKSKNGRIKYKAHHEDADDERSSYTHLD